MSTSGRPALSRRPPRRLPAVLQEDFDDLYNKIEAAAFDFDDELWERVSPEAKELIGRLLTADPFRFHGRACAAHAWFGLAEAELNAKRLDDAHRKMKDWNARRRLKTTAKLVLLSRKRTKDMGSVVGSRMLAMGASAQAGSVLAAADAAAPSAPAELEAPPGEHEAASRTDGRRVDGVLLWDYTAGRSGLRRRGALSRTRRRAPSAAGARARARAGTRATRSPASPASPARARLPTSRARARSRLEAGDARERDVDAAARARRRARTRSGHTRCVVSVKRNTLLGGALHEPAEEREAARAERDRVLGDAVARDDEHGRAAAAAERGRGVGVRGVVERPRRSALPKRHACRRGGGANGVRRRRRRRARARRSRRTAPSRARGRARRVDRRGRERRARARRRPGAAVGVERDKVGEQRRREEVEARAAADAEHARRARFAFAAAGEQRDDRGAHPRATPRPRPPPSSSSASAGGASSSRAASSSVSSAKSASATRALRPKSLTPA